MDRVFSGGLLRLARQFRGLSQREFALKVAEDTAKVSRIENENARLALADAEQRLREMEARIRADRISADANLKSKLRRREKALFDLRGRYGAWDWASIGTMVVATVLGWGLVVNNFADDASWNNWQGYLLGPLGLGGKDGAWAFANIGVLAALVIGLVGGYVLRRSTVQRQES